MRRAIRGGSPPRRRNQIQVTEGWRVSPNRRSVVVSDSPNNAWSDQRNLDYYGGYLVCESIVNTATAHKISACPDMYEALKLCRLVLRGRTRLTKEGKIALTRAEAAILKAEGGQNGVDSATTE